MNRRQLVKYFATLPFLRCVSSRAGMLSSIDDLKLCKNFFIEKVVSVNGRYYDPNIGLYIQCTPEQNLNSLQAFIDKAGKNPLFYRGTIYVDQHGNTCDRVDFKVFENFIHYPRQISPLWEVEYLAPYSSNNRGFIGYFDRELEIFASVEEYTKKQLYEKLLEMESAEGFFRGKIYTNGSNRFGVLACCYVN